MLLSCRIGKVSTECGTEFLFVFISVHPSKGGNCCLLLLQFECSEVEGGSIMDGRAKALETQSHKYCWMCFENWERIINQVGSVLCFKLLLVKSVARKSIEPNYIYNSYVFSLKYHASSNRRTGLSAF